MGSGRGRLAQCSEAKVGEVGRRGLLGFTASTASGEVFGKVLAKGACVPGANHSENRGHVASRLALCAHREGNLGGTNLRGFLRGRKEEVVERFAWLGECKEQGALLRDLAVWLHGGGGAFGAGRGLFVRCHRIIFLCYRLGWLGVLPFLMNKLSAPFGFATPHLQICANKSSRESLTLLAINIVAQAHAGARTTKQLRAGLWIRRIQPMEQNPKVEYANVS